MPETAPPRPRALLLVTVACFVAYLLLGLAVYRDYGISWDEVPTREFGVMNVQRQVPDVRALDSVRAIRGPAYERFGPLFEILLVSAEDVVQLTDERELFLMRHLLTFLTFFLGVVLFHRFCRRRFGDGIALLACLCLVATPQIFAHAFYNTKDISFLTAFVAAILALDWYLQRATWGTVMVHAVASATLLGTRILGLFVVMLTAAASVARRPSRRTLLHLLGYGVVVALLLPLVWPVLRIDPIGIFKDAALGATANPYTRTDLFRGQTIPANQLPWDYIPTWILITTPWVITALFAVGVVRGVWTLVRTPRVSLCEQPRDALVLAWFFLPVLGTVVLRPIMYDGWRHLFFVYPAFVYLAGIGMETVAHVVAAAVAEPKRRVAHATLVGGLLLALSPAIAFMVANHPHQHVYFNRLAGRDMQEIKQRFELDYWGLSYRQALEYIVHSDPSPSINVRVANYPGIVNSFMLTPVDRARVRYVATDTAADYFVTNYRFHPEPYALPDEVFSVRVGNASIASVFRLRPPR